MKSSAMTNDAISRSASRLRWAVTATMVAMALLYLAGRFGLQMGQARVEYQRHGTNAEATGLVGDLLLILLLVALYQLTAMLMRIAEGETFSVGVVGKFRAFAMWLLLSSLVGLFAPMLLQLSGVGTRDSHQLRVVIDFREILTVGVTLVLFLLARLLERARGLDEEVREFV